MDVFEKLGVFYLGRPYDLTAGKPGEGYFLYESRDLLTHGVCVGMTGSGKTGLCVDLLEEAGMDGIPAIIIDPKGDMANLLLTFPDLAPSDFLPWINEDDARKKGLTSEAFAAQQAEQWQKGLAAWGQSGARIASFRNNVELAVYTPGSTAGLPVSILRSFAAPSPAVLADGELLQDQVDGAVTSLLGLLGLDADPVRSREYILLSTLLLDSWRNGRDLDLAGLIHLIQEPSVSQIGVMTLESFYPARDRFSLALLLNNLIASPGFASWLKGEELDIGKILYNSSGKPRLAIFSIAHLGETEKMFFVSLLLYQVLSWMRTQSGTTSLRAILYMDEIFGFFPPVANPPSKKPLLTLLKQARAYGLGILLTTQNPVDLDYKGLANAGTWFIGRLQTERDKMRVLEGLEGAAASQGTAFNRQDLERILAGLGNRVFLMHNVNDDQPSTFETRWCMSYLRGPLTRVQIQSLSRPKTEMLPDRPEPAGSHPAQPPAMPAAPATRATPAAPAAPAVLATVPPAVLPDVKQVFLPVRGSLANPSAIIYKPGVVGFVTAGFSDTASGLTASRDLAMLTPVTEEIFPVDWDKSTRLEIKPDDVEQDGVPGARFAPLPAMAAEPSSYAVWNKDYAGWVCRTQKLELWKSKALKVVSEPDETERDFRIRLSQVAREARDRELAKIKQKYAVKINALNEKIRRSAQAVEREKEEARQQQVQTAISIGATILGSFLGRKAISASSLGRATTAMRGASRSFKQKGDVNRSKETVETYKAQLQELEESFAAESGKLASQLDSANLELSRMILRPARTNILIKLLALAWMPYREEPDGTLKPAW
jgi:hypothetical protein